MIYLDNNATTPTDPQVLEAMLPFFSEMFANPSSGHPFGMQLADVVEQSRRLVAEVVGCEPEELIFTSGATESLNAAIRGVAEVASEKGKKHFITVPTEHSAVTDSHRYLESKGFEVSYLQVNRYGFIDLDEVKSLLRPDTAMVSVMLANNETGVLQPIAELADLLKGTSTLLLSDVTQAVGKIQFSMKEIGVDICAFSGHKIYGPKGIGALCVKKGVEVAAFIRGGGQEQNRRSGTLNVTGIVGLAAACHIAMQHLPEEAERLSFLRDTLELGLLSIPGTALNTLTEKRMPHVTNISFPVAGAELMFGIPEVCASGSSACASGHVGGSRVLRAMGVPSEQASSSLRFSVGRFTSAEDISRAVALYKKFFKVEDIA